MRRVLHLTVFSNFHFRACTFPSTNSILNLINHVCGLTHYSSKLDIILSSHLSHNISLRKHSKTCIFERYCNTIPFSEINSRKRQKNISSNARMFLKYLIKIHGRLRTLFWVNFIFATYTSIHWMQHRRESGILAHFSHDFRKETKI